MNLSLIGIFVGLILLMALAYRGHSIIWVAPFSAAVVAILSGYNLFQAYLGDYMKGAGNYVVQWFPAFFLGAVYGKVMDRTGAARSLANKLVKMLGSKLAIASVVIPCMLMTYGGVSLFVVVFVVYPMGYEIYREANLPRTLLPGAIALGAFGITMTAVPGSPQIQNLIPIKHFGTSPTAAPLMSLVAIIISFIPGYIYLEWRASSERKKGNGFKPDPKHTEDTYDASKLPGWHWITGIVPIVIVVLMLNVFPLLLKELAKINLESNQSIVIALLSGILACALLNAKQIPTILKAINEGANGSITAIMNTACAVGFGSVVKIVPGFATLTAALLNVPGSILFSEAVAVNLLAGATGSASGGMSIALEALAPKYLQLAAEKGINPEYLHRIASLSSGGLDTLPHNGAVLTLLAVSNCTHKESYFDIFITTCLLPVISSMGLALVWGLFL
ncbi:MAG: GntP family permease [Tissierellia bacterium]|nr:GntP family permease [Tissierellia bacterium]